LLEVLWLGVLLCWVFDEWLGVELWAGALECGVGELCEGALVLCCAHAGTASNSESKVTFRKKFSVFIHLIDFIGNSSASRFTAGKALNVRNPARTGCAIFQGPVREDRQDATVGIASAKGGILRRTNVIKTRPQVQPVSHDSTFRRPFALI
jgi:hypothetical protein